MKSQAAMHGDPRHHADDIAKLKAENEALRAKVGRRASSLGPTERYLLDQWGCSVRDAFHEMPYLVGSVARAEAWRDVDVRLMLHRKDYQFLTFDRPEQAKALNVAMTVWGQRATGLPIDFQFQIDVEANEEFAGEVRIPIGMRP